MSLGNPISIFAAIPLEGSPFLRVITAVLPVLCAIMAGAAMRRVNWLTEEADASMMRITINLFAPCLMLDSVIGNKALQQLTTVIAAPSVGFITVALGILVCSGVARWAGLPNGPAQRTFALSTGLYNYGYIPLPLALSLFNQETAGVLFVHNIGVEIAMWSVGLLVLTGHGLRQGWRKIINVPLIAILLALAVNLSGLTRFLPGFVLQTAHLLGQCAIPMGLLLVGATMADYIHEFRMDRSPRMIVWSCLMRLGILPLAMLGLALLLPVTTELKQVMLLQAATPAAVFPIIMAKHYEGDAGTALRIVLSTSLLSILTMPLWIRFGMALMGMK